MRAFVSLGSIFAFLLLAASNLSVPVVAQPGKAGGELQVSDPRGDVSVFGFVPTGTATPITDPFDIVGFRVFGEDIEGIQFEVQVADLTPEPSTTDSFSSTFYDLSFGLEGTQVQYSLGWRVFRGFNLGGAPPPTGIQPTAAQFCTYVSSCFPQRVIAQVDWDQSLLLAYVPKGALAGQEPAYEEDRVPSDMPAVGAGSRLSNIRVEAQGGFGYYDAAPDDGPAGPYVLSSGVPNERIRLGVVTGDEFGRTGEYGPFSFGTIQDFPRVGVTPGKTSLVQVRVENANAAKRIVNLSAEIVNPEERSKWDVRILSTLTVPGDAARIVNLIVNSTPKVEHLDTSLVRVMARSLGFPDEIGALKLRLVASVPPSPSQPELFFHVTDYSGSGICIGCDNMVAWMNTLEQDPRAPSDASGAPMAYQFNGFTSRFSAEVSLDAPLVEDLLLDPNRPIVVDIVTQAQLPTSGTMNVEILTEAGAVGMGVAGYDGQRTHLEFLPILERVPAGEALLVVIEIESQSVYPTPFLNQFSPRLVGGESKLSLALLADPKPKSVSRIPAGPAFLTLSSDNDTDQFVNAGRTKIFPVTVLNEGIEEDLVTITADPDAEGWSVDLSPGDTYRLKPGASAHFGVKVRAPADAAEGDRREILLNATSEKDPSALSQLRLVATVSENVDTEDEPENFTADEDTALALEKPEGRSPGLSALGAFGAILGVVFLRGRSRKRAPQKIKTW